MTAIDRDELTNAFKEALKDFGNNNFRAYQSMQTNKEEHQVKYSSDGIIDIRDALGRFSNDATNEFKKILSNLNKLSSTSTEVDKRIFEKNSKSLEQIETAYQKHKKSLSEEEKMRFEAQIALEKAFVEETESKKRRSKLEDANSKLYTAIKKRSFVHELELENKRLKFQEENLKKTQAIAKVQQDIELTRKKYELKGYNDKGKKNARAEAFEAISKASAYFKGNSAGRILKDAGSGVGKIANFAVSDKQISISDVAKPLSNALSLIPGVGGLLGGITNALAGILEAGDKINKKASDYSRTVGGGYQKMVQMRTQAVATADAISKLGGKAYKFDKILEHTAELSKETGRVMDYMSNLDFKSLEDLRQWGIDSSVLNQFDTFGLSMENIDKKVKSIYNTSGKHGLNAKAVTDVVTKNLKMAQNYTFAGGLRSLERMAEKAVALKYNMEAVSRFADKVSSLEGAAKTGAQLSVLGGDFARMGNPLTMLYGGLQDPERLNEMMLNMTKYMAQWDSQKGQMDISAYNRQRLKAAADAIGVDFSDLYNQAMMQGRHNRIEAQLNKAGNINDEATRDYIKNIAQVDENGKGYVVFHEGDKERRVNVEDLKKEHKEKLAEESKRFSDEQNAKLGDVLTQTRTITEKLNDVIDVLRAKIATGIISIYNWLDRWKGGGKNQIDISGMNLSGEQKTVYDAAIKARDKGFRNLSAEEKAILETANITSRGQVAGKSNEELSELASTPVTTEPEKKAYGGEIRGRGTSKSDSIPAMLSDGEFVMNARAAQQHLPTLQAWNNSEKLSEGSNIPIKAGKNQTNSMSVVPTMQSQMFGMSSMSPMSFEPLNINVNGTINLTGGGGSKEIDIKELLNDSVFLGQLKNQLQWYTNHALDKDIASRKFPIPMYT